MSLIGILLEGCPARKISGSIYIYFPISGYVSAVNVNIRKYVSPTEVLFEPISPTDIHLSLKVFEKDLSKIRIRQRPTV